MSAGKIRNVLISTFDKTNVVEFARCLQKSADVRILSTGGTAKLLSETGIAVTDVAEWTGFPEMLDGRVKTLHPRIHAGLLADRDNAEHVRQIEEAGIEPIDMVVVNLYPFEDVIHREGTTFAQAVEMIDIGGPSMLRAAAKNHRHLWVVPASPERFKEVLAALDAGDEAASLRLRQRLAAEVFAWTSKYDAVVANYLFGALETTDGAAVELDATVAATEMGFGQLLSLSGSQLARTRYGENPHQAAAIYRRSGRGQRFVEAMAASGASYNNFVDASAAFELCADLSLARLHKEWTSVCTIIKHTNPCGVGLAADPIEAFRKAYLGDPNAAMGGILCTSFTVTAEFATAVMEALDRWGRDAGAGAFFVEVWLAPEFEEAAVEVIRTKKAWGQRVRLVNVEGMTEACDPTVPAVRSVSGGLLVQSPDTLGVEADEWRVASSSKPNDAQWADLGMAWLVCKHTKSNAITICRDGMLIGNGAGQTSRVMSCRLATWSAKENGHADVLAGASAASDAFFPFRDGPDMLLQAGISGIVQPGGSKRDEETVAACAEYDAALVLTGVRHFRH